MMLTRNKAQYLEFNFDEASLLWRANKKRLSNGCYEYICIGQTIKGRQCRQNPTKFSDYCKCHNPINSSN
jgi:hypothetical protein